MKILRRFFPVCCLVVVPVHSSLSFLPQQYGKEGSSEEIGSKKTPKRVSVYAPPNVSRMISACSIKTIYLVLYIVR